MKRKLTIEIYRDKKREWRWRMKRSGRIVADSGEGYRRRSGLLRSLNSILNTIKAERVVIV